jgi:hypothetical protein
MPNQQYDPGPSGRPESLKDEITGEELPIGESPPTSAAEKKEIGATPAAAPEPEEPPLTEDEVAAMPPEAQAAYVEGEKALTEAKEAIDAAHQHLEEVKDAEAEIEEGAP